MYPAFLTMPGPRSLRRCVSLTLAILLGLAGSTGVRAQPAGDSSTGAPGAARAQARALGYAGVRAFAAGKHQEASDLLEQAFRLLRVPSLGLWSARALDKLGKLVEADARYLETTRLPVADSDPPVQRASRAEAEQERSALAARLPSLLIRVIGADPESIAVTVDELAVPSAALATPRAVDPGEHRVVGVRGDERVEASTTAQEGQQHELTLRFRELEAAPATVTPLAPAPVLDHPSDSAGAAPWRPLAWWGVGVGAAGLAVGGVTYALGFKRYEAFKREGICSGTASCNERSELDGYQSLRTISGVSLIVGGVLVAGGVTVLLVTTPRGDSVAARAPLALRLGFRSADLVGSF